MRKGLLLAIVLLACAGISKAADCAGTVISASPAVTCVHSVSGTSGVMDPTITLGWTTMTGNTLVACAGAYVTGVVSKATFNATVVMTQGVASSGLANGNSSCYYCPIAAGGASQTVVYVTTSGFDVTYAVFEVSGLPTTAVGDASASGANAGTSWTSGNTGTLAQASELVVSYAEFQNQTATLFTAGLGYTQLDNAGSGAETAMIEAKVVNSTAAVAGTSSVPTSRNGPQVTFTLELAGGGGGCTSAPTLTLLGVSGKCG